MLEQDASSSPNPYSQTVLICVTDQPQSIDLIRAGCELAGSLRAEVRVVCAIPSESTPNTAALDALFEICKDADATMTVAFSAQAVPTIVRVAKRRGVQHIVMGRPAAHAPDSIPSQVAALLPEAKLYWLREGRLTSAIRVDAPPKAAASAALCLA